MIEARIVEIIVDAHHAVLKEHHAEGPITVEVLEGAIRFTARGEELDLRRGGLLALGEAIQHEVLDTSICRRATKAPQVQPPAGAALLLP